jgi:hypothetical protein
MFHSDNDDPAFPSGMDDVLNHLAQPCMKRASARKAPCMELPLRLTLTCLRSLPPHLSAPPPFAQPTMRRPFFWNPDLLAPVYVSFDPSPTSPASLRITVRRVVPYRRLPGGIRHVPLYARPVAHRHHGQPLDGVAGYGYGEGPP